MSYSYDRYERRQTRGASSRRSALGYWLPLAFTVTAATVGIVAWIWSERNDDESDDYYRRGDDRPPSGPPPEFSGSGPGQPTYTRRDGSQNLEDEGMVARMSGALRRTPSPQQLFDGASRRVAAGVAAAGAAVGGALSSIREEDKRDFEDHSRWSEEAEFRAGGVEAGVGGAPSQKRSGLELRAAETSSSTLQATHPGTKTSGKRKTVAIVVSADAVYHSHSEDVPYLQEHASILSHLPHHIDAESRLFVLIYAPDLNQHPLATGTQAPQPPMSITSSYSNIGHEEAHEHAEVNKPLSLVDPDPMSSPISSKKFDRLYKEAQSLVDNDTMIIPFTTPTGHIHILRQLAPEVAYIQETLAGSGGEVLSSIEKWVGQTILVVGDESGHGGLVDSEDERGHSGEGAQERWWQDDPRIGLGKGVEVVDSLRVGEDWRRRVGGHD